MKSFGILATAAVLTMASVGASAASVLAQTPQGSYADNVLGGSQWSTFTTMLTNQHTLTRTADFSSLAQLELYDAVWVDQELGNTLGGAEVSALQSYISSGHKTVLIGENDSWNAWNDSLMSIVGGAFNGECSWATGTPNVANALTGGVGSVSNICGSTISAGSPGLPEVLFSNGMAALYQLGAGQVVIILDSNWNDDAYLGTTDNPLFAQNVVDWLGVGAPIPEPGTYALMLAGLVSVGFVARRRSRVVEKI